MWRICECISVSASCVLLWRFIGLGTEVIVSAVVEIRCSDSWFLHS